MTPHTYPDGFVNQIVIGDCLEVLRQIPDGVVQCCVTSPPYWGPRDYRLAPSIWGGDPEHDHRWVEHVEPAAKGITHDRGMGGATLSSNSATRKAKRSSFCSCGAWLGCYGLEPTLELYVQHTVEIFREVKRVLRSDATLWLNMGDCYASGKGSCFNAKSGLKPKDLCRGCVGRQWLWSYQRYCRLGGHNRSQWYCCGLRRLQPEETLD